MKKDRTLSSNSAEIQVSLHYVLMGLGLPLENSDSDLFYTEVVFHLYEYTWVFIVTSNVNSSIHLNLGANGLLCFPKQSSGQNEY